MARVVILGSYAESLVQFRGHFIRRLLREGHQVVAAAPGPCEAVASTLSGWGARFVEVPMDRQGMHPTRDLKTLKALHDLFRDESPEVFVGYTIKPVVYGLLAAWLADVPSRYALITGLGSAFSGGADGTRQALLQTLASLLYGISLRTSQRVIFQNTDDAYLFCARRLVGGPEDVAIVNGSGVDLQHYRPVPLPRQTTFLLIGRLLRDKGIREYVQAARRIKANHPEVVFRLAGWVDPESPAAIDIDEVERWHDEGTIEFLGRLEDVRQALGKASVFVLPSYREGTPRTVLEAMAMGRPVVTSDAPGCRHTVENGRNGFLVPVGDVEALVRALTHFVDARSLIRDMGSASRELVADRFDVRDVNENLLDILDLRTRPVPPPVPREARKRSG